jgi:F420H(2)-dependent quinone reductase
MKLVRILAILIGVYVALGLALDAAIGYFQPQRGTTAVLRSFDEQGQPHDTVLALLDDGGQLWVESGHWFRGWYHRLQANPDVELIRGGQAAPYRAVPLDTPEAVDVVTRLMGKGKGATYWVQRAMLLFAPIHPVRLDPRPPSGS